MTSPKKTQLVLIDVETKKKTNSTQQLTDRNFARYRVVVLPVRASENSPDGFRNGMELFPTVYSALYEPKDPSDFSIPIGLKTEQPPRFLHRIGAQEN
ncbi:hypothetical protein GWI33_002369 [Rhynchophorus ferrugineus]|uniref:Uncharacterized protein n=1 Tax=Rhynchophorus ferrugineus TaxID=354439 RepID=A0A834HMQ2_RHYFE|nr:hypothetical protein GWI33_002369 [Rhynchophorus ferrugineus]